MAILHLDALPPKTTKGTLIRLLTQVGKIDRNKIGTIELRGRGALIDVPDRWASRLVAALDGASVGHQFVRAWHERVHSAEPEDDHFSRFVRLIDLEAEAEAAQAQQELRRLTREEAERCGYSLVNLAIQDQAPGLGGRCLVVLTKVDSTGSLPWTRLSAGSPVLLTLQEDAATGWRGVISYRGENSIEIALDQPIPVEKSGERYRLDRSADEVARQRQRAAMERARSAQGDRLSVMRRILLGEQSPGMRNLPSLVPLNPSLNPSQIEAVETALAAEDLAIVHGPPGTGKTTAVVELIRQAIDRGDAVLACAPSNLAVDNLFERLLAAGERAVRLGHPARVLPGLRERTLDLIVERHPDIKLARRLAKEGFALLDKANKFTRAKPPPGAKREQRDEAKQLLADARRLEAQVVQEVLDSATVLCATLTGIDSDLLGQRVFDLLVIDEACQSTEPPCWIPLLRSRRVVLAGDHCQLPPTVISQDASRQGLTVSLLERLMNTSARTVARQLKIQYRMHQQIMQFSSSEFYDSSLVADESVRAHLLSDLPHVTDDPLTQQPIVFVDTAGASYDDEVEASGKSHLNPQEAELVALKVTALLDIGVTSSELAVITPYAAQVRWLRERLKQAQIEVDTVDGFQGREKEVVIISLVRSNVAGDIGFLADVRRMNVALTRARRKLILIGDSSTVGRHPFYQRLLAYVEAHGGYQTVWNEPLL